MQLARGDTGFLRWSSLDSWTRGPARTECAALGRCGLIRIRGPHLEQVDVCTFGVIVLE